MTGLFRGLCICILKYKTLTIQKHPQRFHHIKYILYLNRDSKFEHLIRESHRLCSECGTYMNCPILQYLHAKAEHILDFQKGIYVLGNTVTICVVSGIVMGAYC